MPLTERIDLALLTRADAVTAWNRDRGGADQWAVARACPDIAIALLAAAFLVDAATSPRFTPFAQAGYVLVAFVFGYARARQLRSIDRLSASRGGAARARNGERDLRRSNLVVIAGLLLLAALAFEPADVPFLLAVAALDATLYFKAAEPPPPAVDGRALPA